ncbi:MAG: hypothetical protein IAI50_15465 [Candidatus Eremiobacteraeota bacterium]|nr:hypothetical protein [Candidatus Eremiobacteraeota bacterium]
MHDSEASVTIPAAITVGNPTADGGRNLLEEFDDLKADVLWIKGLLASPQGQQLAGDVRSVSDLHADVAQIRNAVGTLQRAAGLHGLEEAAVAAVGMFTAPHVPAK